MKIIAIETLDEAYINGYTEDGEDYKRFELRPGSLMWGQVFPKVDYKGLEHFAGVMGKFDEYAVFLDPPIEVPILEFNAVKILLEADPRFQK